MQERPRGFDLEVAEQGLEVGEKVGRAEREDVGAVEEAVGLEEAEGLGEDVGAGGEEAKEDGQEVEQGLVEGGRVPNKGEPEIHAIFLQEDVSFLPLCQGMGEANHGLSVPSAGRQNRPRAARSGRASLATDRREPVCRLFATCPG
jgi:hypothetical protein